MEMKNYKTEFNNTSPYWTLRIYWENGKESKHDFEFKENMLKTIKMLKEE